MNDKDLTITLLVKAKQALEFLEPEINEVQFYIQAIAMTDFFYLYHQQKEIEKHLQGGFRSPYVDYIDKENIKDRLTELDKLRPEISTQIAIDLVSKCDPSSNNFVIKS